MFIVPLSGLEPLASVQEKQAAGAQAGTHAAAPFQDMLSQAVQDLADAQQAADLDAYALVSGDASDLHSIMIRSAMQQASVEMTVQLASRAVSAYKEVLQMQI